MLFRTEFDVQTHQAYEIDQVAYRNKEGDTIVLDSGIFPPEGFEEFDPESEIPSD